ncbi:MULTISPECIES: GNAT family N-acetyltransferase [Paenibacillus]|uniref:GNAT family N-acetyltransferase n=1 Tax=Paenibacillus polymyxa TaxID=1406 RepID=A0AAP3ZZF9_PAEPO|nr:MULTISPECIES: GNAT family N-acetyltransferase [Paenibacillus]MDH2332410.1 GNAT family N-acetyltransferase [Paenibacillus polymyxa]OMF32404.1 GNAT family N-acetyltransferase [Paenibacillus peoriae]
MKIDQVFEHDISEKLAASIQALLIDSFSEIYPTDRIYFKQLPHFRLLAFNHEYQLIGHVGLDYRIMNLNGETIRVLGLIDLCVSKNVRSQGIASALLLEIEKLSVTRNIDFILLFADNMNLYLRNGYKPVKNKIKWLKIDNEKIITTGIDFEKIDGIMIKEVGKMDWSEGDLDFLGYLY